MHKRKQARAAATLAAGMAVCGAAQSAAGCDGLEEVVGFTLVAATRVQGEFNGCEFDRLVEFENGLALRCSEQRPTEARQPPAYVFLRQIGLEGNTLSLLKVCIAGHIYNMRKP